MAHRRRYDRNDSPERDGERDARDPLGHRFLRRLSNDFARKGNKPMKLLRTQRPFDYLKLVVAFLPKKVPGPGPGARRDERRGVLEGSYGHPRRDRGAGGAGESGPAGRAGDGRGGEVTVPCCAARKNYEGGPKEGKRREPGPAAQTHIP